MVGLDLTGMNTAGLPQQSRVVRKQWTAQEVNVKKTRGGRMAAAKKRAAKAPGGKGKVADRKAGKNIMKT